LRYVLPLLRRLLGWLSVIIVVLEPDGREVDAPGRDRPLYKMLVGLQSELFHPSRLVANPRNLAYDLFADSFSLLLKVWSGVLETVLRLVIIRDDFSSGSHS